MILHLSIDAHDPFRVADALAEILNGRVYKFLIPGSYLVIPFDHYGTHIVVLKEGDVWAPNSDTGSARIQQTAPTHLVAAHTAISVPTNQSQIEQIGKREGWRTLTRKLGEAVPFSVVEFWVENRRLFEFLPPEFVPQYLQIMQPEPIQNMMGLPL
ncbi:MAG: hypothetical protein ACFCVD_01125 [Nodosilinea sp.]